MLNKRLFYSALTIFVCSLIIYCIFRPVIWDPDNYFFGPWSDGIKNYYTALYYAKYDKTTWFTGMNYPFGDNTIYSDNQPALMWFLKLLNKTGLPCKDHVVGVMNILMLLSIPVAAYFIFLILIFFRVEEIYASLFGIAIAILSPQIERITGHYGLSYSCYIPMIWYFLLRTYDKKILLNIYTVLLVASGCLFTFLHVYLGLMYVIFVALFTITAWLGSNRKRIIYHSSILILSLAPLIALNIYRWFTDPITDRHPHPYGFNIYNATWQSIFLPLHDNFFNLSSSFGWFPPILQMEGISYIGLTGLAVTAIIIFILITHLVTFRIRKIFEWNLPPALSWSLIASILILLLSMCYPFRWNMMWLADKFSFIKQFRSLGRLSWIFYYVYSVAIAYLAYLVMRRLRMNGYKLISSAIALIIFLGWGLDGLAHLMHKREAIVNNNFAHSFTKSRYYPDQLSKSGYKPEDFQAIVALPFYHVGGEKFYIINEEIPYESYRASFQLRLPLFNEVMARSSVSLSGIVVQIVADTLIDKKVLDHLPDARPIFVMSTGNNFSEGEKYLISHSKFLWNENNISAYVLYPSDLERNLADEITKHKIEQGIFTTKQGNNIYSSDSSHIEYSLPNPSFINPGIEEDKVFKDSGVIKLYTINVNPNEYGWHEYSAWIYMDMVHDAFPILYCRQYDSNNNKIKESAFNAKSCGNVYKDWVRAGGTYSLEPGCTRIEITCEGYHMLVCNFIDRKTGNDFIIHENETAKLYNNYPVSGPIRVKR